ncbi:MAG: hypothetical protein ACXAE3_01640 [Candidatus Kariarchaeaceae archaeon]|jgi:hypothetical protein
MVRIISFSTTVTILLIFTLLVSLLPSEKVEVIIPNQQTEYIYNSYSRKVTIEANFVVPIKINVSRIDLRNSDLVPLYENFVFQAEVVLNFTQPGFYLFQIISPQLIRLTFNDSGFRQPLLLIAIMLIVLKGVLWLWDANLLWFNPQRL